MQSFRFERVVAWRYLRRASGRDQRRGFLQFITVIALGGVTIGVAALVLSLTIVRGFSQEIEAKVVGFGAHVQVESYLDAPLGEVDTLAERLQQEPGVVAVTPAVVEFALLRSSANIDGVQIWGTPPNGQPFIADHLERGAFTFEVNADSLPGLVVGSQLAAILGLDVGSVVTAFSMRGFGEAGGIGGLQRPRVKQFYVAGVFETGLADFDELFAFTDLNTSRALFEYGPEEVTRLDLLLHDMKSSPATTEYLRSTYPVPILARSIYEVYPNLFAWIDLQRNIIPLVISILVLVAAFNIIGALLMLLLEKSREVGILLSMGASARQIQRLFLVLGLWIGILGTFLGEALALGLALVQLRFHVIPLPQDAYYIDTAPIALNPLDFLVVAVVTILLCVLAAWLPARAASRIDPVRTLRFAA